MDIVEQYPPGSVKIFGVIFFPPQHQIPPPPPPPQQPPQQNPPPPSISRPKRSRNPNLAPSVKAAKKPRKAVPKMPAPPPHEPLPQEYLDLLIKLGANSDPVHLCTKFIYASDVNDKLNRLTIPSKQILKPFLTPGEENWLRQKDNGGKTPKKLAVKVIDPLMVERTMSLAKWNWKQDDDGPRRNKSWWYALTSNWMNVVNSNGLLEGDCVQLWSFRINQCLGFIIHKVAAAAAA